MEPVSIIVTALVLGAANGLKDVAEESIKDIYTGLKQLVLSRYTAVAAALNLVESDPQSQPRQGVLEEDLNKAGAAADEELLQTAKQLISLANSLMSDEALAKVGVAIKNVEGGNLEIRRIQSVEKGVVVSDSKFTGDITISDVNAAGGAEDGAKKEHLTPDTRQSPPSAATVSHSNFRDITIYSGNTKESGQVQERLDQLLKGYDERINEAIAHRLISRTEDDAVTSFSSERLLISLARLGIPLVETLSVLDQVGEQLGKHAQKHPDEEVTTWHLRQIVFQSLHRLDPGKYDRSDIEKWGNAYARRFGNPKNRTSVIMEDGDSEYLTFQFLTEQLIPEIVTEILDIQFDQLRTDLISNKDIQRIADEILSVVQYMNVYEIHYDTLYRMVSDIALNPPHPWVVKRAFDGSIIEYDLERATDHAGNMLAAFEDGDFPSARHKCMECLEHSCSALLAYYGVFMGVKPFHNLMRTLKLPDTNPLLWKKLKIHQLEGDLSGLGRSLMEFQNYLTKANKLTSAYSGEKLGKLINRVTQIYNLVVEVLEHRKRIEKQLFQIKQISELSSADFLQTVVDVFASIPNFKMRNAIKEPEFSGYWFEHNIHSGGILHKLDPRLLVAALHNGKAIMSEQVSAVIDYFEKNRPLCNTVMIICNKAFEPEAETMTLAATRPSDRNIILLTAQDLRELYYAEHRVRKLGELMMDFYDKL